jgi:hypothetical protein
VVTTPDKRDDLPDRIGHVSAIPIIGATVRRWPGSAVLSPRPLLHMGSKVSSDMRTTSSCENRIPERLLDSGQKPPRAPKTDHIPEGK